MPFNKTEAGLIVVSDPGSDKPLLEVPTLQCVHCGGHWVPQSGSGRVRGFCQRCMGPICGPGCAECVPVEQYLENMEKGRPDDFRPTQIIVP
jgi:hypothetical protein